MQGRDKLIFLRGQNDVTDSDCCVAARIPDLMNHDETACALDNLYFSLGSNEETQKTSVSKTDN